MKSLPQIKHDNRMTNCDFGGMCNWLVFRNGGFLAAFVMEHHAQEFANALEYEGGPEVTVSRVES